MVVVDDFDVNLFRILEDSLMEGGEYFDVDVEWGIIGVVLESEVVFLDFNWVKHLVSH